MISPTIWAMVGSESLANNDWIFDTGACDSVAKSKDAFIDLTMFNAPQSIAAANGTPFVAHGIPIPLYFGTAVIPGRG